MHSASHSTRLICLTAIMACWGSIDAKALTPEELTKALYVKLAASVMPNGNDLKVGKSYFIVANPGILVGKPEDLVGEQAQQALVSQIDMTPKKDPFFETGLFHLAKLYSATIDEMEVPHPANEADLLAKYKELQTQKKTGLQEAYKTYDQLRTSVATIDAELDDYLRAEAARLNKDMATIPLPTSLTNKRKAAGKALKDFPSIVDVAALEDKLATIENSLPFVFKERLRQQFADKSTGGEFPKYVFFPAVNNWGAGNWTKYATDESDLEKYSKDEFKSTSGGLGYNTGLGGFLGGNVSGGKTETWKYSDIESKGFKLEYEIQRVGVYRPWLDSRIFTSRRWRMPKDGDLGCHTWSIGDPLKTRDTELSPFIVKSVVLSRNLKISGNWTKDLVKEYSLQESVGGHVRWGFFSVGANHNHTVSEKQSSAKVSATSIENPDIQIIGFVVEPIRQVPDPDPTQPWITPASDCKN